MNRLNEFSEKIDQGTLDVAAAKETKYLFIDIKVK